MPRTDLQLYTKADVEKARDSGQLVGWVQGAGSLIVLGIVLKLVGWIPAVLVLAGVGYLVYRLFAKPAPPSA
jgi:hypothetical protein